MKVRLDTLRPGDGFRFEGLSYMKVRFPGANAICPQLKKFADIPEHHFVSVPPFTMEDSEEGISTDEALNDMRLSQLDHTLFPD